MVESLINTKQKSQYEMVEMDLAWQIILDKTRKLANQRESNTCVKDLDDVVPGDILVE